MVVLHDNLGAVEYALQDLKSKLGLEYLASGRWEEVFELNSMDFQLLSKVEKLSDDEWKELCPVNLLISCLPVGLTVNKPSYPNPTGRQVGRRRFIYTGELRYYLNEI